MRNQSNLQIKLYTIIFGTNTPAGKLFDLCLIGVILVSVTTVVLDSIVALPDFYHQFFFLLEWVFTLIFTIEYFTRIYCFPRRWRYIRSFWGIVDLIAILPSYLALFLVGSNYLAIIRLVRVLRVFEFWSCSSIRLK